MAGSRRRVALRLLARTIADQSGAPASGAVRMWIGTVQTVTAGAATDGNAAVAVKVNGSTVPAPYNLNYTPAVGHTVLVALLHGSPVIICRVGGFPSF